MAASDDLIRGSLSMMEKILAAAAFASLIFCRQGASWLMLSAGKKRE
jgi:hypothetical protein